MHVASARSVVRGDPDQSDIRARYERGVGMAATFHPLALTGLTSARIRKILPGAILLAVLALLGGLSRLVF